MYSIHARIFLSMPFLLIANSSSADQIRNRYTHELIIGSSKSNVSIGIPGEDLSLSEWTREAETKNAARICMRYEIPKQCLTLAKGRLFLSPPSNSPSQKWKKTVIPDSSYVRLENLGSTGLFLHVENGALEAGKIEPGWWSAMWAFDKEPIADARSVHLQYHQVNNASEFYIEVNVKESHPGTYFAAIAFDGGYFGIQELTSNHCTQGAAQLNKQIIYSLWNEDTSSEDGPEDNALARVISLGPQVEQRKFSGEGSGVQTYKCFDWKIHQTYQFHLNAKVQGRYTVYRAYFKENNDWQLIAEAKRPANGKLISGVYSFVEDFARTGKQDGLPEEKRSPFQKRAADFMNPWHGKNRRLAPIDEAKFTAWSVNQPLTNITAFTPAPDDGAQNNDVVFHLATGGKVTQQTELNSNLKAVRSDGQNPNPPTSPPSK